MIRCGSALAILGFALGALGGCATSPEPSQVAAGPSCGPVLAARGAVFESLPDRLDSGGCQRLDAVRMSRSSVALDQPVQLGCPMALRLTQFEEEILQPAARRHLGQALARLRHFGGYSCRARTGDGRYISEHALANAIDVAGFDLADGTQINVDRYWNDPGPRGAFLREVARGACRLFNVVLTPKSDALHRNHFHLDLSRYKRCDA